MQPITNSHMNPYPVSIVLAFLCCFLNAPIAYSSSNNPTHFTGDISINCGSTGAFSARNGREWIGDVVKPKYSSLLLIQGKSTTSTVSQKLTSADLIPHETARISRSRFSYTIRVKPGQKIIRLHFNPSPYKGFKGLNDLFTVEAGPFILLTNFSASLTAHALGVQSFSKEFCLNIQENQLFNITFSPESSQLLDTYAFVNGIEIISVPNSLSYFHGGETGLQVVGQKSLVYVDHHTALELIHRLNIKQSYVTSTYDFDDTFPTWAMRKAAQVKNKNWKVAVDVGFGYLIRLHFSEMGLKTVRSGDVMFEVRINEMIAHIDIGIIKGRDENSIPRYRDYMVMMRGHKKEGRRDILISLQSYDELIDGRGLLAGFEIFKLSNPDNSLASPNPLPAAQASPSMTIVNLLSILGQRNAISTVAIIVISLVSIIVHKLQVYWETYSIKEVNKPSARAQRLCHRFSLAEIQLATRNFSGGLLIGKGGFGKVYKGLIDKGQMTVAVKRLKSNSMQGTHEFLMKIETLSELRHVNLVSLIGYCNEHREMILVYDYMAGGTLADHLYKIPRESNNCSSLSWKQRLNICIGAGRGLDYLHTGHGVIHRDVKTSNILLDENFVAKVSDFGLAKHEDRSKLQSHVSTRVKGTNGYLDPHYLHTRKLTRKTDTYAFGVVLLEILCGRPAVDLSVAEGEHILTLWARDMIDKGEVDQIVDLSLREEISPASLKTFVGVVERCLRDEPKNRPTLSQVVLQLDLALEQQENEQVLVLNEVASASDDIRPSKDETEVSVNSGKPTIASTHVQNLTSPSKEKTNDQVVNAGLPSVRKDGKKAIHKPSRLSPWDAFWSIVKPSKKNDLSVEILEEANIKSTKFDWDTIVAATNEFSFSNKVGHGGFGPVYKGVLPTGHVVAVKRLSSSSNQGMREFKNELLMLPNLQHRNIIKLLGYCIHREEKLLLYEFMENISLDTFIFGEEKRRQRMPWPVRLKIITGIARGVVYLHQDSGLRVLYRDLKTSNILLDSEMNPKISDFAFAKTLVEQESELEITQVAGTIGYMSPEYGAYGKFSVKSDVYSYGIIVLEIISGRRGLHEAYLEPMLTIVDYALELWNEGKALDLVDESLGGAFSAKEAVRCIQVALLCTKQQPQDRPTMPSVLKALEGDEPVVTLQQPRAFHEICEETRNANINFASYDWDTVSAATSQFSPAKKVGQGVYGTVCKGVLPNGQVVAVKRLLTSSMELKNDVLLLPKLQHQNIIKLLGYCVHGGEKLLVYEFTENLSLDISIFGEEQERQNLPWPVRSKIITGIARGLVYLHHDSGLRVVFRDLKSSNILLDSEMNPKISDFAFAMLEHQSEVDTSRVVGTYGCMPPEYGVRGRFSFKSDVFSFGIIVLEIVSGWKIYAKQWESTRFLLDDVWRLRNEGKALDLVDKSVGGEFSEDEALRFIQIGLLCTQHEPHHRPTMASVLEMLLGKEDLSLKILQAGAHRNEMLYSIW